MRVFFPCSEEARVWEGVYLCIDLTLLFFQFLSDAFGASPWRLALIFVDDFYLQLLVPDLVNLQFDAKAPATLRKYRAGWLRWRSWAFSKFCVPVIPFEPLHVALILTDLTKSA